MTLTKQKIRENLNKKYSSELWRSLFSEIFSNREFFSLPLNKPLNETESKTAKSIKQIGKVDLSDNRTIALFEVELKSNKDVNRNRVELRNLISKDLLSGVKDGALVTYHSLEKKQYRFTFVSKQTKISEKGEFEEYETDTKRFTYVLGETESCNTPAERFLKLSEVKDKKLSDIEEAFSVEKVSKEFFAKYKEHFDNFNKFAYDNFKNLLPFSHYSEEQREKAIRDFNKKLLGRIVFIYFLQKKGWIGVPKENNSWVGGSTRFLSETFNKLYKGKSEIFYLEFLEPLFYDTLNSKREDNIFSITDSKIPFLNGGLFEPEEMEKRGTLFYSNELFEKLFEYFDQYNFTIIEDSVEEQEVAIDPEMLGHIFENLLEDNKDKGTFYTPKEIVKYMCQESLVNYLDTGINVENVPVTNTKPQQVSFFGGSEPQQMSLTNEEYKEKIPKDLISSFISSGIRDDNKNLIKKYAKKIEELLDDVRVLDPAIGSGAFPMGMLHEIFNAKLNLDWTLDKAETKRKIIENSIYGVDIEKGAVDIAMLRFWLSLVVDEEEPSPLPNLDYKIMVGNSLTGDNIDTDNMFHKHFLEEIQTLRHEFYKADDPIEKKKLKKQIEEETHNLAKTLNVNLEDGFNFKMEFSEVFESKGGFDIVIGNPPYLRIQGIRDKNALFADFLTKRYKSASGSFDLYVVFVEKSLKLIKSNGFVNFIMPTKWTNAAFGKGLRQIVAEKNAINKIINFGSYQVFNASTYTGLQWFKPNSDKLLYFELNHDLKSNYELSVYLQSLSPSNGSFIPKEKITKDNWVLTSTGVAKIIDKLNLQPRRISDVFDKIFQGLATSKDDVYFLYDCNIQEKYISGLSKHLNKIVKIEKEITKPLLKGEDVHRYEQITTNRVVIFPYRLINGSAELYKEDEIKSMFPLAYSYLKECEPVLRGREKGRLKNDIFWYRYIYPKNLVLFSNEKLVAPEISFGGNFSYDKNGDFYSTTKIYGYIKKDNIQESYLFWLGLFNSKLFWYFIQQTGYVLRGGYFTFKTNYILPFPVPATINPNICFSIENLVKIILLKKQSSDKNNTDAEEKQIDNLIYELYNLKLEDIRVIENIN